MFTDKMSLSASYSPSILVNDDTVSERPNTSELREEVPADFNDGDHIRSPIFYSQGLSDQQHNDEVQLFSPPFFYSQGNYTSYFDKLSEQKRKNEMILNKLSNNQAQTKKKIKRKRDCSLKSSSSTSYIARRDKNGTKGRYVIKINIHELTDCDRDCSDSDDASVSVQYIVREPFDEVMDATQALVRKISNKLEEHVY